MHEIGVIIPAHNAALFVREALESTFSQTRVPTEIVLCDDASADATASIVASYGDRVRLVRNEKNLGAAESRNKAAQASTAEYVAFLDADDRWDPDHLEKVAGLLDRWPEAGLAFSRIRFDPEELKRAGIRHFAAGGVWPEDDICVGAPQNVFLEAVRGNRLGILPSAMVVRRQLFEELGGFRGIRDVWKGNVMQVEDVDFAVRAALRTKIVAHGAPTVYRRFHAGQTSVRGSHSAVVILKDKLNVVQTITGDPRHADIGSRAVEKLLLSWNEWLVRFWSSRDVEGLRMMVLFGCSQPLLRADTLPYVPRSCTPRWLIRIYDATIAPERRRAQHTQTGNGALTE